MTLPQFRRLRDMPRINPVLVIISAPTPYLDALRSLRRKPWFTKYVGAHWPDFTKGFVAGRQRKMEENKRFMEGFLGNLDSQELGEGKSGPSA